MKRGFTLVELLAVIVLLSILAGIVLLSVNTVIINSKKSLTDNQIVTIELAAQNYYLKEGINDSNTCVTLNFLLDNGYLDDNKIENFAKNHEMNGHVQITYKANQYSYKYNEGQCPPSVCTVVSGDGTNIGDEIDCAGEYFYVIENDGEEIVMLAKYNLNVGDNTYTDGKIGIQNENVRGWKNGMETKGIVLFSTSVYWDLNGLSSQYGINYPAYVYDNNSKLYKYIENYEMHLENKGVSSVEGSLISYEKLIKLGCRDDATGCGVSQYSWLYNTSYWTGSAYDSTKMWGVNSDGDFGSSYDVSNGTSLGVRPVITILTNEL